MTRKRMRCIINKIINKTKKFIFVKSRLSNNGFDGVFTSAT